MSATVRTLVAGRCGRSRRSGRCSAREEQASPLGTLNKLIALGGQRNCVVSGVAALSNGGLTRVALELHSLNAYCTVNTTVWLLTS